MRLEKKQFVAIIILLAAALVFFTLREIQAPQPRSGFEEPAPTSRLEGLPQENILPQPEVAAPNPVPPASETLSSPETVPPEPISPEPISPEPVSPTPKSKPVPSPQITPAEASEIGMPLTKADAVISVSPGSDAKLRVFSVSMTKDGFEPETIVVNRGDTVQFKITAVHESYDIFLPYLEYQSVIDRGKTLSFSFDVPESGKFDFSCRDRCPAGKTIRGEVIVL